ncbi:hypothetical protein [Acetobacter senegalensis]|uniref:hypothetical protein n=1 Tax=Acetobacter senegalensis TaxID=446692 RepID=UPI001E422226|nr:hypothetical protein [Acetobacter senegalensis]
MAAMKGDFNLSWRVAMPLNRVSLAKNRSIMLHFLQIGKQVFREQIWFFFEGITGVIPRSSRFLMSGSAS